MRQEILRRLVECASLPSLPAVVLDVLALCRQPDFDLQQLAHAVGNDPALATKLLETVNSPLFGTGRPVTTLSHAVVCLGARSVRTIALSFTLVRSRAGATGFDHARYWRRSLLSAVAAKALAGRLGTQFWEEAFVGALLQDIGVLALSSALGLEYGEMVERAGGDHAALAQEETDTLGADHAQVGAWLVDRWKLPPVLGDAVRRSHDTACDAEDRECAVGLNSAIVAASGALADIWLHTDTEAATVVARTRAHDLLGMDGGAVELVLEDIAAAAPELARLFETVILPPDDLITILDQARESLARLSIQHLERAVSAEAVTRTLEARNDQLQAQSELDPLTSLGNRRRLEAALESEFAAAAYLGQPLSVLFCDIDHFKRVNDTHGHHTGDIVLANVAEVIAGCVRKSDHCARYGGEEFVVLLPNSAEDDAHHVAERIRAQVERMTTPVGDGVQLRVTISVGGATNRDGSQFPSGEELMQAADAALYEAKHGGRNRVVLSTAVETVAA